MRYSALAAITALLVASQSTLATAAPILFDLRAPSVEDIDGSHSLQLTEGGITATLTANGSAGNVLNRTGTAFGVDTDGAGDDTDTLDGVLGNESVTITFDQDIFFSALQLSLFSAGESATISIAGGTPVPLSDTGVGDDVYLFASGNSVMAGQSVVLTHVGGNGFSFDNFTVNTAAVPEPSSLAMLGTGIVGLLGYRRRRQRSV